MIDKSVAFQKKCISSSLLFHWKHCFLSVPTHPKCRLARILKVIRFLIAWPYLSGNVATILGQIIIIQAKALLWWSSSARRDEWLTAVAKSESFHCYPLPSTHGVMSYALMCHVKKGQRLEKIKWCSVRDVSWKGKRGLWGKKLRKQNLPRWLKA